MKKNFEAPELMVQTFAVEDVITTSVEVGGGDGEYGGTGGGED